MLVVCVGHVRSARVAVPEVASPGVQQPQPSAMSVTAPVTQSAPVLPPRATLGSTADCRVSFNPPVNRCSLTPQRAQVAVTPPVRPHVRMTRSPPAEPRCFKPTPPVVVRYVRQPILLHAVPAQMRTLRKPDTARIVHGVKRCVPCASPTPYAVTLPSMPRSLIIAVISVAAADLTTSDLTECRADVASRSSALLQLTNQSQRTIHSLDDGLPTARVNIGSWSPNRASVPRLSSGQIGLLLGSLLVCVPGRCRLVIIQMWIANVVVIVVRFDDLQLPSLRDFCRWLPVSFLVSGMLGTSIFALEGTTVSTVTKLEPALRVDHG
eukprot:Skav203827  [mRNA]  locus=scaffold505:253480:262604:- [translate_table: standard]